MVQPSIPSPEPPPDSPGPRIADLIDRNVRALLERRRSEDERKTRGERLAHRVSDFAGRMSFVYFHVALVFSWVVVNLGWVPGVPRFDPTFVILATVASVEAIFISTFILITQNRMSAIADQRADLDLHINLLAEHELTRLLELVSRIAEKLDVDEEALAAVDGLGSDVHPEHVLERLDQADEDQADETDPLTPGPGPS